MSEVVYTYDGSFDGFLSCVFARYANKEVPIAISRDEDFPPTLFPCRFIPTDPAHARRVLRKVLTLSPYGARLLQRGFLTCLPDRELALLNLVTCWKKARAFCGTAPIRLSIRCSGPCATWRARPMFSRALCAFPIWAASWAGRSNRKTASCPCCAAISAPGIPRMPFSSMTGPTMRPSSTPPDRR